MNTLHYITCDTPEGIFHIIIDGREVARASGFGAIQNLRERLPDSLRGAPLEPVYNHPYEKNVAAYFNGDKTALDMIPRDQDGTELQKKVWRAISDIPYGKTISYKQLAEASGSPAAVRAAGTICGLNRLILIIPCHRILKSDGGLGGYVYGTKIKQSLLEHERRTLQ